MKRIIRNVFSIIVMLLFLVSCREHVVKEPPKITVTYQSCVKNEFTFSETTEENTALSVDDATFYNYGCNVIDSWNTAPDGSGISYEPGKEYVFTSDTVLYAQWGIHHISLGTTTTLEPTCTSTGISVEHCGECGYQKTSEIPMLEHEYIENYASDHRIHDATCTVPALYYKSCRHCGKESEETFSSAYVPGHRMGDYKGQDATCLTDGWKPYQVCYDCGYSTYEKIEALGHDITKHEAVQSTCTEQGWNEYETCSRCSYNTKTELDLLPHSYVEIMDKKYLSSGNPCVDNAVYYKSCSVCGVKGEETFTLAEPLGHDYQNYRCTRCSLWTKGPAGGCVFYDCDDDNTDTDPDGADNLMSSVCGWRFLEVAPSDVSGKYCFGYCRETSSSEPSEYGTRSSIGAGKSNFELLLQKFEGHTYNADANYKYWSISEYALKACDEYYVEVDGVKYDDWFIPSSEELILIYNDLYKNGLISLQSNIYWSSTEWHNKNMYALKTAEGKVKITSRCDSHLIRAVRAFK